MTIHDRQTLGERIGSAIKTLLAYVGLLAIGAAGCYAALNRQSILPTVQAQESQQVSLGGLQPGRVLP